MTNESTDSIVSYKDLFQLRESTNGADQNVLEKQTVCWPRDWLSKEFPNARIITVGFDLFLSKWSGEALPLEEQSLILLKKLKLAAVGSRPTIFVTHSFGGLLVKEMLRYASRNEDYQSLLKNTKVRLISYLWWLIY